MNRFVRFVIDNDYRFVVLGNLGFYKNMPDDEYLRRRFKGIVGMELNLDNPKTFNEKIQWLKLYDRNPIYTKLVDKYEVKQWVADKIGKEYIIPTLGIYDRFAQIDFNSLPQNFVIKCTHDSGSAIICKNKENFNPGHAKKKIEACLKRNAYYAGREWAYKNVKPRIIIEKYLSDSSGEPPNDYKVFNFNGEPRFIQVDYQRFVNHKRNLYTKDWEYIEASIEYPTDSNIKLDKPKNIKKLLEAAKTLSKNFPHCRTDFYCIDNKLFFGEMTFYHGSGTELFYPEEFGLEMGSWLKLPTNHSANKYACEYNIMRN